MSEVVRAQRQRHRIEEFFEAGNGEAGLDHYEVRSWVGWHHHMTLSLVALWFLCLERRRVGGENPGDHSTADAAGVHAAAPAPAPTAEEIAAEVTRVLRRNEESRIYHWHKATGEFPPRRKQSESTDTQNPP